MSGELIGSILCVFYNFYNNEYEIFDINVIIT